MVSNEHQSSDDVGIDTMEIFMQSGELYFGGAPAVISTMLHSRMVITVWHPGAKIGGMCHVELPESAGKNCEMQYGDCAITEFAKLAHKYDTPTSEYEIRVYVGSRKQTSQIKAQETNLQKVKELLKLNKFNIKEIDAAATGSRKIKLDLSDGSVETKEIGKPGSENKQTVARKENKDEFALEIFLHPGDLYFGRAPTIISTLLGSCVAVTLWHPKEKIGGMCHIVLPELPGGRCDKREGDRCNMRYGDCAICEFVKQATKFNTVAKDYDVHIYGGSDMFPDMQKPSGMKIGNRNIEKVKELLKLYKFHIKEIDAGGSNSRKIKLDLSDGSVWARQTSKPVEG